VALSPPSPPPAPASSTALPGFGHSNVSRPNRSDARFQRLAVDGGELHELSVRVSSLSRALTPAVVEGPLETGAPGGDGGKDYS